MSPSKNVLFLMTGSIACYKACSVLSKLKQNGFHIKTVMSRASLEFIGTSTVEGLTGQTPITDMYQAGHVMDHINLVRWADVVVAAPATAHFINKISAGLGDDLLTTLFLAHDFEKPFLIAPAMNTKMYLHPATQNSIQKLKKMPLVEILETASGVLACGEVGSGRLLEPDLIYNEVNKHFQKNSSQAKNNEITSASFANETKSIESKKLKVLVTGGGTSEPIDDVRVITNKSTGKTAAFICDRLSQAGAHVTYIKSETAAESIWATKKINYQSFKDLQLALKTELQNEKYDMIVHLAAVSDYSPTAQSGKINSDADELVLTLKRNPKLINQIKEWSAHSTLVGFKLTSKIDEKNILEKVQRLFQSSACDYVVQNDWGTRQEGQHQYRIFSLTKNSVNVETSSQDLNSIEALCGFLFQKLISKENL